jgi:hypothetical protein
MGLMPAWRSAAMSEAGTSRQFETQLFGCYRSKAGID